MGNKNIYDSVHSFSEILSEIDFEKLPVSDYNKKYINRLKPFFHYYLDIYASCIVQGFKFMEQNVKETVLVDFGGGCGFLSMFASYLGFGKIIYVDLNPKSVHTVSVLKELTGFGPDIVIEGSSGELKRWCSENSVIPDLLIATDLIEHVYDLDEMFMNLSSISDKMNMIYTTASSPYNPIVKRKLRKTMMACENGSMENPNYYTLRLDFIKKTLPDASADELEKWAKMTRGLIFPDIKKAIDIKCMPRPCDKFNTCDPRNGNWMERILPISFYEELGRKYGYMLSVGKGFYNIRRESEVKGILSGILNLFIAKCGKAGFLLAPFIVLFFKGNRR